ncbi:MAG TPA: RyR domain-containing protein [bacterium]|nr:RyR domain-containing protein [bacterium]
MAISDPVVLVTGDVMVDHHLYGGDRPEPHAAAKTGTREFIADGGAGLLFHLLAELSRTTRASAAPLGTFTPRFGLSAEIFQHLPEAMHGYALWKPFPADKEHKVWRIAEPLGYGSACSGTFSYAEHVVEVPGIPKVVVIDDGGLGFRQAMQQAAWPGTLRKEPASGLDWAVLKMSSPLGQGDLWRCLSKDFRQKLVVVVSISDIRKESVKVSKGISWERTVLDLAEELCGNAAVSGLLACRHLVVHFGMEGALHVDIKGENKSFELIYDPEHLEREWNAFGSGEGFGYKACLTAGIVSRLLHPDSPERIQDGIRAGLSAMRTMHLKGHGPAGCETPHFPFDLVARDILQPAHGYAKIRLPEIEKTAAAERRNWTILTTILEKMQKNPRPLYGIGRRVAVTGPKALAQIPCIRFGNLFTADRNEIEGLRNIRLLIEQYEHQDKGKKPLCLAVFGPPGAGKSFGICEIARGILGKEVPILEFNLSQFKRPEDLIGAFHQVRDKVLLGTTPVVFWDEFDSDEYKWLQYFLVPMQDGKFLEGQITHPVGKSIFIFAGGTSYDMENFGPAETDLARWADFKLKKGPDFKSRLGGYLNVLGPNRRQRFDPVAGVWADDPQDICFPVRRALLLRSMLRLNENERLAIDHGVLSALIEIDRYRHGARSLEKILLQLKKPGSAAIHRSDLPADESLAMQVDVANFTAIYNRNLKFQTRADELAPFVHDFYRKLGKKEKWLRPEMDRPYNELAENYQEDNRAAAARIPEVLDLVGLLVVPSDQAHEHVQPAIRAIIAANMELLAEAEHNEWQAFKLRNGWTFGVPRDEEHHIHDLLKPYHELSERAREKDRNAVRHYPEILKKAGYGIVATPEAAAAAQPAGR